jgi:non-ribosomal peptide synthetase component F
MRIYLFDLVIFDLFMPWYFRASVHVVPASQRLCPLRFIQQQQLTVWYWVHAIILFMQRLKVLKKNCLSTLRLSLFAGEALSYASVMHWRRAASHSRTINLYGPAEVNACLKFMYV